ncbi:MAG: alanine-zipper protein, partial [Candidatus Omnitrophota bacterium]
ALCAISMKQADLIMKSEKTNKINFPFNTQRRVQNTEYKAQSAEHRAQSTKRKAQSARRRAQGAERKAQSARRRAQGAKGVSLIIVIFAIMLLGVLGWSLAVLQSTDFEASSRQLESEKALYLAEAGTQWALNQLWTQGAGWRTDNTVHTLSSGEYEVTCCTPGEGDCPIADADAVIISTGFVPAQAGYRTMRKIKMVVMLGSLTKAIMTQTADAGQSEKGLLNWWPAIRDHDIDIDGDIDAGHYEGDGDGTYDELAQDYDPQPPPVLPLSDGERGFTTTFPVINMQDFYDSATNQWPSPSSRTIEAVANPQISGQYLRVNQAGFFDAADINAVAIRRTNVADWWQDDTNWTVIVGVDQGGRRAQVEPDVPSWGNDTPIRLIKRFYQSHSNEDLWYIGGEIAGGTTADTLIDLNSGPDIIFTNTYLVSEGDIVIKGANGIQMKFTGIGIRYPVLATKNGDIISLDLPTGPQEKKRRDRRQFSGLIYSELGHVNLNYLTGTLVYGDRITLDGEIDIRYRTNRVSSSGFIFAPSLFTWQEQ